MKVIGPKKAIRNIATIMMAATVVASSYSVILPAVKVSAEDKKIEEIFEDKDLQKWVSEKVDKDDNGYLSQSEIDACTSIDISEMEITTLKGLECFTKVRDLECDHNKLTKLDTSCFPNLQKLDCSWNQIDELDLTNMPDLILCECGHNKLKTLDMSKNTILFWLNCEQNELTDIKCSEENYSLETLKANGNDFTSIELSKLNELEYLYIADCSLTSIDVSSNEDLTYLDCSYNSLERIDISKNLCLALLNCDNNKFEKLNGLKSTSLLQLECNSNKIKSIDLSGVPNLVSLSCSDNQISSIDLSRNTKLRYLYCHNNNLKGIDAQNEFTLLDISNNMFTDLDSINMEKLEVLKCGRNKLTKLDLSSYSKLQTVDCSHNQITDLKIDSENLLELNCCCNEISDLDISKCPMICRLDCSINKITSLDISKNDHLITLLTKGNYEDDGLCDTYKLDIRGLCSDSDHCWLLVDYGIKTTPSSAVPSNANDNSGSSTSPSIGHGGSSNTQGTGSVDTSSVPSTGNFEDFVERLYVVALGRASEEEGKAHWCKVVGNGSYSGADCARFFLTSPEFNGRNLNNEEYLKVLYKTFFDRDAANDPDGFNFWLGKIDEWGRGRVLEGFIDSTEWCNICASYGVKSGAMTAKATKASANATAFATRLYTECLGREPEEDGLNFWSLSLTNQERTGTQAAKEFFYSEEFISKGLSDDDYVTRLYKTFMGREPEADGKAHWLNQLNSGAMNRDRVFDFFSTCEEFTGICNQYAISR